MDKKILAGIMFLCLLVSVDFVLAEDAGAKAVTKYSPNANIDHYIDKRMDKKGDNPNPKEGWKKKGWVDNRRHHHHKVLDKMENRMDRREDRLDRLEDIKDTID